MKPIPSHTVDESLQNNEVFHHRWAGKVFESLHHCASHIEALGYLDQTQTLLHHVNVLFLD
jgi:hypothetical protein